MVPPGTRSLRHRLAKVMAPCLRLALGLVVQLPHSSQVRQQAAAFMDAHSGALVRVLQDASSLGTKCVVGCGNIALLIGVQGCTPVVLVQYLVSCNNPTSGPCVHLLTGTVAGSQGRWSLCKPS